MHRLFCPESDLKNGPDLPVIVLACAIPEKVNLS